MAAIIPILVFGVFNGALVSALVPVFSGYFASKNEEDVWRLSSTVINVITNTGQIQNSQFNDGGFGDIGMQWLDVAVSLCRSKGLPSLSTTSTSTRPSLS